MFSSIVESVAAHADKTPEKLCLADRSAHLTYRETWNRIVNCAHALEGAGITTGCVVIECVQNVEYAVALLAVQLLGAQAIPLEKNASSSRRTDIARKVSLSAFIGPKPCPEFQQATFVPYEKICQDDSPSSAWTKGFPSADSDSELMFSTGTTGIPKGVVLTHRNDVAMSKNIIDGLHMGASTRELILVPLNHAFGLRRMNANLMNGSTVLIAEGALALKRVFDLMDAYHANALALSANTLSVVFKLSGDRLGDYAEALDYVQLSSAMLPEQDKNQLISLLPNARLYNFYGSTESGATCLFDFNEMSDKPYCIGKPIGDARFIVVDEKRAVIESSYENMGIIACASSTNMRCYYNDDALTAETMQDGFVYTKDLGYIDGEGFVYVIGRADDVINFGGIKVAPEEIEHAVEVSPIVRDCACVAIPDELSGQVPVLCIVLEDGVEYDEADFRRFITSVLGANERPKRIVVLDEIPRTYNGKVKRREIVSQLEA